jgi:hypothetical protein
MIYPDGNKTTVYSDLKIYVHNPLDIARAGLFGDTGDFA